MRTRFRRLEKLEAQSRPAACLMDEVTARALRQTSDEDLVVLRALRNRQQSSEATECSEQELLALRRYQAIQAATTRQMRISSSVVSSKR